MRCKPPGKFILASASTDVNDVLRILRAPFDVDHFNEGLRQLSKAHQLDILLLDTSAGLNENTLLSMALANSLLVMLRPDIRRMRSAWRHCPLARLQISGCNSVRAS